MIKSMTVFVVVLLCTRAWAQNGPSLTLLEACREAQGGNREAREARLRRFAASERIAQARTRHWPQLGFSTDYSRSDRPSASLGYLVDQGKQFAATLGDRPDIYNYRTEVLLSYLVYDGGERTRRTRISEHERNAARHRENAVRSMVLTRVVETFYNALCAEYQIEIAKEEVSRMEKRLQLARSLKAEGRATAAEIAIAEYHLERAGTDLVAAQHADADALERLGWLLGRDGPVTEALDEGVGSPLEKARKLLSPESAERTAESECSEAVLAEEEAAASAEQAKLARSRWLPRAALTGSYGFDGEDFMEMEGNQDSYFVEIAVTWDIFDAGLRGSRVREANDLRAAAGIRVRSERQRVKLRARSTVRNVIMARREHEASQKKTASDLLEYQQSEKAYASGRGSFRDLLDAQSDLAADRLAEARAYCDSKSAEATYLEAIGFWVKWESKYDE